MGNSRISRVLVGAAVVALAVPVGASSARAGQVKYVGGHPIPGGGFCYIEAPHVHVYKPHKSKKKVELLYRVHDDHYHFVGDPVGHGYDGPKHAYYGHHPIAVDVVYGGHARGAPHHIEYCYLDGPHYHWYAPPNDLEFTVKGGAYWYVGAYPPAYGKRKKAMVEVNAVYRPMAYTRPVIEVEPPAAYIGPVVEVHAPVVEVAPVVPVVGVEVAPGHVHGPVVHGEVRAGVEVRVPAPTIEVGVGLPGVVVVEEHHHHKHKVKTHHYKRKVKVKHKTRHKRKGRYRP